ncbi:MAG: TonB-dependent receptor, partial [Maribacter sp.]|nr:TonB-dependent receptor [Maribacter sp.]
LDIAGRNDWASTLALTGNDSYFYPSFGLTALLSEMFDLPEAISFAKLRASYASVGNEIPYNAIFPRHTINSDGSVNFNTTKPFTDAKPEIISTTEFGLDWRFFQNRLGIDFTYYNINSQDQFIEINQPIEDFTSFFVNAGEITNKGVEITLTGKPIVTEDLTWSTALNYSKNTNEIVELHPDTQSVGQGGAEGISIRMVEGGSIGDIYARKFQRDDQGRIMLDDGNGRPLRTDRELFGNAEPDYIVGWSNTVNYKDWALNMQINGKFGGLVASQTEALLDGYGVSERSAVARDRGYEIINAVQNGSAVSQIDPFDYYDAIGGRNGIDEPHIYDRTSVRLSQLALSYNINVDQFDWLKNASVSFIGNNLFFFHKDAPFDPEIQQATGRNNVGIDNYNLPSTRTYGLNLSLTF